MLLARVVSTWSTAKKLAGWQSGFNFRFLKVGGLEDDFDQRLVFLLGGNPDEIGPKICDAG